MRIYDDNGDRALAKETPVPEQKEKELPELETLFLRLVQKEEEARGAYIEMQAYFHAEGLCDIAGFFDKMRVEKQAAAKAASKFLIREGCCPFKYPRPNALEWEFDRKDAFVKGMRAEEEIWAILEELHSKGSLTASCYMDAMAMQEKEALHAFSQALLIIEEEGSWLEKENAIFKLI